VDACGGRPPGVEHQQELPVAFRAPGAHDDIAASCRCAPVDRPRVVTDDVLAQGVELRALAADRCNDRAVELAQPGELLRKEAAAGERREDEHSPVALSAPLSGGEAEWTGEAQG